MITGPQWRTVGGIVPVEAVWADPKTVHESGAIHNERALAGTLRRAEARHQHPQASHRQPEQALVYLQRQVTPAVAGEYIKGLKLGASICAPRRAVSTRPAR